MTLDLRFLDELAEEGVARNCCPFWGCRISEETSLPGMEERVEVDPSEGAEEETLR
jgi:hypothetical protein